MIGFPPAARGQRIGLYGGSFNPPHAGHLHVSRLALRRLRLDAIWWLVTPGNPLKDNSGLPPLGDRLAAAQELTHGPKIRATAIEKRLATTYTVDTVRALKRRYPGVDFVWIMGADSLAGFHRWKSWRDIAQMLPIAVIDRPGFTLAATASPAARALARFRVPEQRASRLAAMRPPAFAIVHGPRSSLSSTALRHAPHRANATTAP